MQERGAGREGGEAMRWRVPIEAKATFTGYLLIEARTPQDAVRIAETVRHGEHAIEECKLCEMTVLAADVVWVEKG